MGQSPLDNELRELSDAASYLESELTLLKRRIRVLEELVRTGSAAKPAAEPPAQPSARTSDFYQRASTHEPAPAPPPVYKSKKAATGQSISANSLSIAENAKASRSSDATFEVAIGKTWMNRIGAFVLLLGVGFFVKYSFDQGWISPTLRVCLGAATGLVLVGVGQYCVVRKMQAFAIGLLGAGIAILYFSAFASHYFYQLTSTNTAFVLLCAITALSTVLAVRGGMLAVAVLGLVGGFWTPLALSTGTDQQIALMSYLLVLNAGFLLSGMIRKWDVLRVLCWLFTSGLVLGWYVEYYHAEALHRTLGFLLAFYLVFHAEGAISLRRGRSESPGIIPFFLHADNTVYFAATYFLATDTHLSTWLGLFCVVLAGSQIVLGRALRDSVPLLRRAREGLFLDAAAMLALAAPIQFDRHLVPLAWGVQAVATAWFCRQNERKWLRAKVVGILAAALVHLVYYDVSETALKQTLLSVGQWPLNWITVLFVFLGLCSYFAAVCLAIGRKSSRLDDQLAWCLLAAGSAVMLGIWAHEYERYLATWWWLGLAACWMVATIRAPVFSIVVCILSLTTCGKFLSWDTLQAVADQSWSGLSGIVLNRAVITGVLVSIAVALSSRNLRLFVNQFAPESSLRRFVAPEHTVPGITVLAMLVLTWAGTFEIARIFSFEAWGLGFSRPIDMAQSCVSGFWALNALAIWILARQQGVVLAGYAVVIGTAASAKLLLVDTLYAIMEGRWQYLHGFCSNRVFVAGLTIIGCWFVGCAVVRGIPRQRTEAAAKSRLFEQMLVWGAILSIWLPTFEILRGFRFEELRTRFTDPSLAMHLALSILWSVSAITLLAVGFARLIAGLRYLAISVFGITLLKVFIIDLSHLQTVYRIVSFVVLGLLLLLASLLYQWLSARILRPSAAR